MNPTPRLRPLTVLVLRAAGTNCDTETAHAFEAPGVAVQVAHVHRVRERPAYWDEAHLVVVPGGFSYGDDLGAGRVLGALLRARFAAPLERHLARGHLVLGICNGFQALVQAGLLPGFDGFDEEAPVTLALNDSGRFQCEWVTLDVATRRSPFLARLPERVDMPIAHAEGKLVPRDEAVRRRLADGGHVALRYAARPGSSVGRPGGDAPYNPNGSTDGIAGLLDASGQVLGLMPHPERHALPWQHPDWRRPGFAPATACGLFDGALAWLREQVLA